MAITTPNELIRLALRMSGVNGVGQAPSDADSNDAFELLNLILSEWQLNRWLVYNLVEASVASTAAASYTVGPAGNLVFAGQRPDKIDACYAKLVSTGADTYLYPFMSREGYDRVALKSRSGIPESFFYDPGLGTLGTIFIYPVPPTGYSIRAQAKASLGQFNSLAETITLPRPYVSALLWNLAVELRPLYQMDPDPKIEKRAEMALQAITGSIAQVPQITAPTKTNRSGVYSGAGMTMQGGGR